MEIWNVFTNGLMQSMHYLSTNIGLGEAIAIMFCTLIGRLILMPVNLFATANMYRNKITLAKLKPEIDSIKSRYKDEPSKAAKATMDLYKKHDVKILDKKSVVNLVGQGVFGFGMFQTLQTMVFHGKFAWIADIAKPDVGLALLVGVLTFFTMLVMPSHSEQINMFIIIIPAVICTIMLVNFSSAIGIYWATSSLIGLFQSLLMNKYFNRIGTHKAI